MAQITARARRLDALNLTQLDDAGRLGLPMLNVELIKAAMARLGLTGAALSQACGVSKEAVSNWLSGESIPRPSKLTALAATLGLAVEHLIASDPAEPPEPVVAFRMRNNRPLTAEAKEAGEDVGRHLRQLLPFMGPLFTPRHLMGPKLDEAYVEEIAGALRAQMGVGPTEAVTHGHLLQLLKDFGAVLVPVYWGGDKVGHENAMSVYLPDSKVSWVLLNVGCRLDDLSYWLAHEFGHCLTLHALTGDAGETFAELFAQTLLFPQALALKALEDVRGAPKPAELVAWYAGTYGISVVTVVRAIDKAAQTAGQGKTGLASPTFYAKWKGDGKTARTASDELFGSSRPSMKDLVIKGEQVFGTPAFRALARWQREEGGRSPSFVAAALNLKLGDAVQLSHALQELQL